MHQTINTELAGKPGFKKFRVKLDDFECLTWAADSVDAQRDARASANTKEVKLPECEEVPADWEFPKEDQPADAAQIKHDTKHTKHPR